MTKYLKKFLSFIMDILVHRRVIWELVKNDFRARYLGSYLGILWAFIQPAVTILILWFIFEVGFRAGPVNQYPYVIWLMAGLLPWNFFAESLSTATGSIMDQSYLVKRVVFKVSVLPVVKIFSALLVHLFFLFILLVLLWTNGFPPQLYHLQVFYYLALTVFLVLGLSWITSSLVIFMKDLGQIVAMILQFGFWLTPIFWNLETVPEKYHFLIRLNPVYYLVDGYRKCFISGVWLWDDLPLTVYFFSVSTIIFVVGAFVYMRLRPHFADVL